MAIGIRPTESLFHKRKGFRFPTLRASPKRKGFRFPTLRASPKRKGFRFPTGSGASPLFAAPWHLSAKLQM